MNSKTLDSRYGKVEVFEDDLISKFIQMYGEWAYLECEFISSFLPYGAKVFDLGAFIGTFTLGLNTFISEGRYLLAELNPDCWEALKKNLSANVQHFSLFEGAVATSSNKTASIRLFWEKGNQGTTSMSNRLECSKIVHVPVATITNLVKSNFIPDLIKLDIEGHELDALKHSQGWLTKSKPILWIECNESSKSLDVFSWLNWMQYRVFYFAFPSHNPDNFLNNNTPLYPFAYEAGLLALGGNETPVLSDSLLEKGCFLKEIKCENDLKKALWYTPRWSHADWLNLSCSELIALLAHYYKHQNYEDYIKKY